MRFLLDTNVSRQDHPALPRANRLVAPPFIILHSSFGIEDHPATQHPLTTN